MVKSTKVLTLEEIKHIAKLANLSLADGEVLLYQKQLSETLDYINHLNEIDTSKIEPTYQVNGKTNELREDVVAPGLSQEEALANAPKVHNGYFVSKVTWN